MTAAGSVRYRRYMQVSYRRSVHCTFLLTFVALCLLDVGLFTFHENICKFVTPDLQRRS